MPNFKYHRKVTTRLKISGTVASFDLEAFTVNFAATMGVDISNVEVTVEEPGEVSSLQVKVSSLQVKATVSVTSEEEGQNLLNTIVEASRNTDTLAESLGETIEEAEAPKVEIDLVAPPPPESPSPQPLRPPSIPPPMSPSPYAPPSLPPRDINPRPPPLSPPPELPPPSIPPAPPGFPPATPGLSWVEVTYVRIKVFLTDPAFNEFNSGSDGLAKILQARSTFIKLYNLKNYNSPDSVPPNPNVRTRVSLDDSGNLISWLEIECSVPWKAAQAKSMRRQVPRHFKTEEDAEYYLKFSVYVDTVSPLASAPEVLVEKRRWDELEASPSPAPENGRRQAQDMMDAETEWIVMGGEGDQAPEPAATSLDAT